MFKFMRLSRTDRQHAKARLSMGGKWCARLFSEPVLLSVLLFSLPFQSIAQSTSVAPASLYVNATGKNKVVGLSPSEVRHAYGFDQIVNNHGEEQTIGIVIPFHNPNLENDLDVFSQKFGLPRCTVNNCAWFERRFYPDGIIPVPPASPSILALFQLESALDVEWAHAIAPRARIVLVETTDLVDDLMQAVDVAVTAGEANVISMSWGVQESIFRPARQHFLDQHFIKPKAAFVASAGDSGNYSCHGIASLCWPGSSPYVTSVGGTMLHLDSRGNYTAENAWKGTGTDSTPGIVSGSGGGLSINEDVPAYQLPFNTFGKRGVPDVSYNANPNNGFAVYNSNVFQGSAGWLEIGGTSAGAPQWAGLIAIVNSIRSTAGKETLTGSNPYLYGAASGPSYDARYHDIVSGTNTNGQCGSLCSATKGYDFVTGLGSPQAGNLINALVSAP